MPVPAARGSIVRFGVFEADFEQRVLSKSGQRVRLQDQPFQILRLLVERPGELVTRDEIRQQLWTPDTYVEFDDGLNTAIKKLRTALNDSADNPRFIETVPRRGYRFIAPVSYPAPPETGEVPVAQPARASQEPPRVRPAAPSPRTLVLAIFFLVAVVAGGLFYRARHEARAGEAKPSLGASVRMRPSIAVLGFQNSTGRPDQAWLSTALSQMLSTELAEGEQLRMVSSEQIARAGRDNAWQPGETPPRTPSPASA